MCNWAYFLLVRDLTSEQREVFDSALHEPIDARSLAAARQLLVELGGAA